MQQNTLKRTPFFQQKFRPAASNLLVLMLFSSLMVMILWRQGENFTGFAQLNHIAKQDMQQSLQQQYAWRQFVQQDLPLLKITAQQHCAKLTDPLFDTQDRPNFVRLNRQNFPKNSSLLFNGPLPNSLASWRKFFQQSAKQQIWCKAQTLFNDRPKKKMEKTQWHIVNELLLNHYLTTKQLIPTATSSDRPLILKKKVDPFYVLNQQNNVIEIHGKVKTVIVSTGNVQIKGKGILRGALVAKGAVEIAPQAKIDFRYNKGIVDKAMKMYARWQIDTERFKQLSQRGWRDF